MSDQFFDTKVLKTLLRRTISRQNFDSTHLFESDALMIKRCVCDQEQESLTKVSRYYMIFFVKSNCLLKKVAFIRPCKFSAVACQSALFCHPERASHYYAIPRLPPEESKDVVDCVRERDPGTCGQFVTLQG